MRQVYLGRSVLEPLTDSYLQDVFKNNYRGRFSDSHGVALTFVLAALWSGPRCYGIKAVHATPFLYVLASLPAPLEWSSPFNHSITPFKEVKTKGPLPF